MLRRERTGAVITKTTPNTKAFEALRKFAHQRPGLEPGNYFSTWADKDGRRAYASEARAIAKQLRRFKAVYSEAIEYGVTDADLDLANTSDRLTWSGKEWDYCTGQYFPTEYRNAAANKLERAVSVAKRRQFQPMPEREYLLGEMREIATRSGSNFFTNTERGDKYKAEFGNKITVRRGNKTWARYQFNPKDGTFDYIESSMTEGAKL